MVEVCSKEEVKEFIIRRLHLTPETLGKTRDEVPTIVRDIGGLQYGGHNIELLSRFESFKPEWFDYWYENYTLVEGHVLRGALRIIHVDEYPLYFKATRTVSRRRSYQHCPMSLTSGHNKALGFMEKRGPFTPSEFAKRFGDRYPQLADISKRLLYELYNYGEIARMGREGNKPLYNSIEKLPYPLDMGQVSEKEAMRWLFLKCLSVYGPSTLNDVAHWVGWTLTRTKSISKILLEEDEIMGVDVEGEPKSCYLRVEDLNFVNSLRGNLPDHSFVKILFNDDALLLGCYRRLKDLFGYRWRYPQLSEGVVWRAAILHGRELVGEAIVDMYAKDPFFKITELLLRKKLVNSELLCKIESEFSRHAFFQNKRLQFSEPQLV